MKKIAAVLALVLLAAPAFAHEAKAEKGEKGKSCCAGGAASADKCPAKGEKKACADDKAGAKAEKPADAKPSANKS